MRNLLAALAVGLFLGGMAGVADAASFGTWVSATAITGTGSGDRVDHAIDGPTTAGSTSATLSSASASGTANAVTDITGTLRVFASATGRNGVAVATAGFYDTLTYIAPAGFTGDSLQVTYLLHVSGTLSGEGYPGTSNYWNGKIWDAQGGQDIQYNTNPTLNAGGVPYLTDFWVTYTRILPVAGSRASNVVNFGLVAYSAPSADGYSLTLDFSHTALVSQTLPDGWTFSSASGKFLEAAPVPVPATVLLMAPGLFGAIAFRRKFRK